MLRIAVKIKLSHGLLPLIFADIWDIWRTLSSVAHCAIANMSEYFLYFSSFLDCPLAGRRMFAHYFLFFARLLKSTYVFVMRKRREMVVGVELPFSVNVALAVYIA